MAAFGIAALARRVDEAQSLARVTGTSIGKAKDTIATGKVLSDSAPLGEALRQGEVSLEQAAEIAKAEESAPGAATELLSVAKEQSFQVLKEKARKARLEAEQQRDLFTASAVPGAPAATATSWGWCTSTWPWSRMWPPRSWPGRRRRPSAWPARPDMKVPMARLAAVDPLAQAPRSPSSAT